MADVAPVVLITGATSGLGGYLARELASSGWQVLAHGRDPARVADLAAELGGGARGYVTDLASLGEVRELAALVRADAPRLDVLVNNAAVGFGAPGEGRQVSADGHELRFEQGGEATMRLITDPALDGVTGQFFDGLRTSRARS
jgi:NAD(P)-dependent dehydrogenase (short-subunit alcohol dehydrogenase family)